MFRKIEQSEIDELRKRFSGQQVAQDGDGPNASAANVEVQLISDPQELEKSIAAQGEVVRSLKERGADKASIVIEVDKLLKLKAQLAKLNGEPQDPGKSKSKSKSKK